jgi:hypothetical protein
MSRTYRHYEQYFYSAYGKLWSMEERDKVAEEEKKIYKQSWKLPCYTWKGVRRYDLKGRDKKAWKPPKWFKRMNRQQERARERSALQSGKEVPLFKKRDMWEWS